MIIRPNLLNQRILICIVLFVLNGCTTTTEHKVTQIQDLQPIALPEGKGWWIARFGISSPDTGPQWHLGTMLAGEILALTLKKYRAQLDLWRFHRRAMKDDYGHVFSFRFYSSAATAQDIFHDIEHNEFLSELKHEGHITWVGFDNTDTINRPGIADTSDKTWPVLIQKTWPSFIMGVSEMWLEIVLELADKAPDGQSRIDVYKQVQDEITNLWMAAGSHAFLHHLNAVFAYHPLLIRY